MRRRGGGHSPGAITAAAAVSLHVSLPHGDATLDHLILDVNGTLTVHGDLVDGASDRVARLGRAVRIWLLSADTFGGLDVLAGRLRVNGAERVVNGEQKVAVLRRLGSQRCIAIGNGANDAGMLNEARLGICIIGAEGAATSAVMAANLVFSDVCNALDALLEPRVLIASLRP